MYTEVPLMPEHSVDSGRPWLRSYDSGVAPSIDIPPITIPDLLRRSAQKHPNQIATVFLGGRLSYRRLLEDANRFAHGLASLGVKSGDRVAIMLPNCPQTIIAYYATLSLGAVAVMTNPLYTEPELVRQWTETGVEVAVVLDRVWPRVRTVRATVPLRQVIVTGIQDYLPFPKNLLFPVKTRREGTWVDVPLGPDTRSFRQVMRGQPVADPVVALRPDDLACLQYTGGTTGVPKGAMLTHANLVATVMQIRQFLMPGSQEAEDRIVAILPIFHAYGMNAVMNLGVHLAATLILIPLPDLPMLLRAVRTERPTFFLGIPALYAAINNHPGVEKLDLTSIKACFSGGAPLPLEVIKRFEQLTGARIAEAYGLTEASSVTHVNPRFGRHKLGSVGLPIVGCDARIVDAETGTRDLPAGEVGEIAVRGPQVMKGYWRRPAESDAVLRDGPGGPWLFTGDLGKMDEDGYFFILDRKKDLILSSGFNVYPREVEDALAQHPAVQECTVIGLPDALRGERIKAFVILKQGAVTTPAQLISFCRDRLAPYKVPRAVEFRATLPRTGTGKVNRRLLREEDLSAALSQPKTMRRTDRGLPA
jgi:long-chain acyl-CoA synthetase